MGREVRRVPANWNHPTDGTYSNGEVRYRSLFAGPYSEAAAQWDKENEAWLRGMTIDFFTGEEQPKSAAALQYDSFSDWDCERPNVDNYMPEWQDAEKTHYMMYETTSEGSPISPAFETPEQLAQWLADNEASAFGNMTADYDHWLRVAKGGFAPSMVVMAGNLQSGVQALD